jgi:sec-independent protein translocase protein TatC
MDNLRRALRWLLLPPFRLVRWLISLPFRFLGWLFHPVVEKFKQSSIYKFLNFIHEFLNEDPDDRPAMEAVVDAFQNPEGVLEHLEDVRKHLLRSLLVLAGTVGASFWFTPSFLNYLAVPVGGLQNLQAIAVTESIGVFMKVALISGIAIAIPYIAFEIWLFFAPGIKPRSKKLGLVSIPFALVFFVGGMAFAYYVMLPAAVPFLSTFLGVRTNWTVGNYMDFVSSLIFWIGVAFEFPLVIFGISAMGLIEPKVLLKQWRLAVILIAVLAAMITPTVDPVNMSLVMGPMIGLYFLSIFFSWLAQRSRSSDAKSELEREAQNSIK